MQNTELPEVNKPLKYESEKYTMEYNWLILNGSGINLKLQTVFKHTLMRQNYRLHICIPQIMVTIYLFAKSLK